MYVFADEKLISRSFDFSNRLKYQAVFRSFTRKHRVKRNAFVALAATIDRHVEVVTCRMRNARESYYAVVDDVKRRIFKAVIESGYKLIGRHLVGRFAI